MFLRKIVSKFNAYDNNVTAGHWGVFYTGHSADRALSVSEQTKRNYIKSGAMPKARASAVVKQLDSAKPFTSRNEFIEALAALAAEFPEDMSRKVTGANKRIDEILWCAADPDRAEWLLNNLRWRHLVSLELSNLIAARVKKHEEAGLFCVSNLTLVPTCPHMRQKNPRSAAVWNLVQRSLAC